MSSEQRLGGYGTRAATAFLHWAEDVAEFFFPRLCEGCDRHLLREEEGLCLHCTVKLPRTFFWDAGTNPVETLFQGRLPVAGASAFLHFTKEGMARQLIHRLKYKGQKELGAILGEAFAQQLVRSGKFPGTDVIIPVPLHPTRERRRGYNQSLYIANGMSAVMGCAVDATSIVREQATDSQTRKDRFTRSENVGNVFTCTDTAKIEGRTVLLVDDVVTTGSTLEGAGRAILEAGAAKLYVAALAFPQ